MSSGLGDSSADSERPLSSQLDLPAVPSSLPTSHYSATPSSSDPAAASTSGLQRSVTPRRRRMNGRLSRSGLQIRNSTPLDPEASEFHPAVRMPSKRKASASSSKSSKTLQMASKMGSSSTTGTDLPIINANDIIGPTGSDSFATPMTMLDTSSDDESGLLYLSRPRNYARATRDALMARLPPNRISELPATRTLSSQKLSAVLVSQEFTSENSTAIGSSHQSTDNVRYLPLCPASTATGNLEITSSAPLTVLPKHRDRIRQSEQSQTLTGAKWPLGELPVELFDLITAHLSRDDVKSMRLVSTEFEQKVSRSLFHTSVVPFNTELYDMIDEDKKKNLIRPSNSRSKGKGKMKVFPSGDFPPSSSDVDKGGLQWQNAKEDKEGKVYKGHGLRVFKGFGPHIKRFGMSFEVSERQLAEPPIKKELDLVESYHGSYDWPSAYYARFANLAGLENTADETSRMKAAFSNLDIVQELALSIDSGLGWLSGPDKSLHSQIFERRSAVFGTAYDVPDWSMRAATEFWHALQQSQLSFVPQSSLKEVGLEYRALPCSPSDLTGIRGNVFSDTQRWSSIDSHKLVPSRTMSGLPLFGVVYTSSRQQDPDYMENTFIPSQLKKEQKEWLLETQWAQQAFLESYMLAIIDNPTFEKVTTLNIAKLSSRFLPMLAREVFWNALPCLSNVVLHVSPDWRSVEKDDAGFATTKSQSPSEAVRLFHKDILRDHVCMKQSIRHLNIGWYGGGEHAEGMHARNANILPAPVTLLDHSTANNSVFGLDFKNVEHLTLFNCWIAPPILEGLVKSHSSKSLKKITLDSVSLTAHPKFPPIHGQGGGVQQFAQAVAAVQAQLANHAQGPQHQQLPQAGQFGVAQQIAQLGPGFLNGLQGLNPQQLAVMQQQWNMQMQQMQQLFNANANPGNGGHHGLAQIAATIAANQQQPAPAATANMAATASQSWAQGHREGSWPQLLDTISPGPVFNDYLPPPAPWDEPLPPRPESILQSIEFNSCGYAKLPNHSGFEQFVLEPDAAHVHPMSQWFRTRWSNLKSHMLESRDRHLGQIVQYIPQHELDALQFAWGLTEGWNDRAKAEEAEFDGLLPGGTGRFSGTIKHGMGLVGRTERSSSAAMQAV